MTSPRPMSSTGTATAGAAVLRRADAVLLIILLIAALPRLYLAGTVPYFADEADEHIPLAESIVFLPSGSRHMPLRSHDHPALVAYIVKVSSAFVGTSPLGYRFLHVLAGLATIAVTYLIARPWYGTTAARWAAALIAFNEYHIALSARATAGAILLFLVVLAMYAFHRFVESRRPVFLYWASAATAFAFYCKELALLLLPVFFFTMLQPASRSWLRSRHVYLAAGFFCVLIGPDVFWNSQRLSGATASPQGTYADHLARVGGIGLSPYPVMFFGRDVVVRLHDMRVDSRSDTAGIALEFDHSPEYAAMNPALGMVLVGSVLAMAFRQPRTDRIRRFLLTLFLVVFGFFSVIRPGGPGIGDADWFWVDMAMLPAAVLAGACLGSATLKWRLAIGFPVAAAMLYAIAQVTLNR